MQASGCAGAIVATSRLRQGLAGAGGPAPDARGRHCRGAFVRSFVLQPCRLYTGWPARRIHFMTWCWPSWGTAAGPYRALANSTCTTVPMPTARGPQADATGRAAPPGGAGAWDDVAIDLLMAHTASQGPVGAPHLGPHGHWRRAGCAGRCAAGPLPWPGGRAVVPPGLVCDGGQLCPEWRDLLLKHPTRFVIGSDTWVRQRWQHYEAQMWDYRTWLGGLANVAQRVAWGNAAALLGWMGASGGQPAIPHQEGESWGWPARPWPTIFWCQVHAVVGRGDFRF